MVRLAITATVISLAVFCPPAFAASPDCNGAVSQLEINDCFNRAYQAADRVLNEAYRKRMGQEDARGKTLLTDAQRAWILFRDKACTYETAESEGGSIRAMEYSICLIGKTEARAKELN